MIGAAVAGGVVDRADGAILLVAVALSMMAIPSLGRLGAALARRRARELDPEALVAPPDEDAGRVIIVGYGRVGDADRRNARRRTASASSPSTSIRT